EEHFYTTAMAAVDWIMSKEGTYKSVTYIGGAGMKEAVNKSGLLIDYKDPDVVFVGMNRELGYKDYCDILQYISGRSLFISTDNRKTQRYDGMMMIGNGSIVKMLEYASNKEAISFGRGSVMTIHLAMRHLKSYVEDAIFVSHRFQDDLLTASIAGMETTLITEGKDIYSLGVSKDYYPTSIADSLEGLTINASLR
ncbi:MAG: hypothetical protein IJ875_03625, partial [Solobacterium sp.]|nr:hypothetical protein [Solobacterium sp.]